MADFIMSTRLLEFMSNTIISGFSSAAPANNYIYVYKGTMPSNVDTYTQAGYTSDQLIYFNNFYLVKGATSTNEVHTIVFNLSGYPNPITKTAEATGTATWFAMYRATATTKVILGTVSAWGGNGALRLDSVDLVSGNNVSVIDIGIQIS